jgi:hypothetical protein
MDLLEKYYSLYKDIPVEGYYSQEEYLWLIERKENWIVDNKNGFLHFGNAGCDGIEFRLRKNLTGVWAFYPSSDEYLKIADTISAFKEGWTLGEIQL